MAFRQLCRLRALEAHRHEHLAWCILAPHYGKADRPKVPQVPAILKEPGRART